ncbi:hypothetical protein [Serratia fonticola]|uniref:hypothetical protein n=1 Tax=Serratia fonticola TaxID=47917 RepID=UPI003AAC0CF2
MKNIVENQGIKNDKPLALTYEQLKQQLDAVVAECATQKGVIDAVVAVANQSQGISGWHLNGEVAGWSEILPEIYDIETPATSAALAEAAAQGVEKFADAHLVGHLELALHSVDFAIALREGRV